MFDDKIKEQLKGCPSNLSEMIELSRAQQNKINRWTKWGLAAIIIWGLLSMLVTSGLIYAGFHFIVKYW